MRDSDTYMRLAHRGLMFTWNGGDIIDVAVIGEDVASMEILAWPGMDPNGFRRECYRFAREYHADCLTVEQVAAAILTGDPEEVA